jgi:hypothetical protein
MKIMGWGLIIGLSLAFFDYPPGFMWGNHLIEFPRMGPAHSASPYDGLHPYVLMIGALYLAWAILMIRGANHPKANAALFDFGILANLLHGLLMIPQAFIYPKEHAHLWTDVPVLFALSAACWIWHPNRAVIKISRVS